MATKAEIRNAAARKVGILGIGQTLSSQYHAIIDAAYDALFYQLREKGFNTWAYAADVPTQIEDYYSTLVAGKCALELGASSERIATIAASSPVAMREIQLFMSPSYASGDDPEDF